MYVSIPATGCGSGGVGDVTDELYRFNVGTFGMKLDSEEMCFFWW